MQSNFKKLCNLYEKLKWLKSSHNGTAWCLMPPGEKVAEGEKVLGEVPVHEQGRCGKGTIPPTLGS